MKLLLLIIMIAISPFSAFAGAGFSLFGGATNGSNHSTFSASYDDSTDVNDKIPLDYSFSAESGRSQFTTSFVEGLAESKTKITKYGFGANIIILDMISLGYDFLSESINEGIVVANESTVSPGFKFGNFNITYGYGKRKVMQQKSYVVLLRDIKDDLQFTQSSDRGSISYRFSDSFSLSFSHTRFKYDRNMETSYSILSNTTLATNNGTDMLSQIYSLLDSTTELSGIYTVADRADIEVSVGKMIDFYNPKSESSDVRFGVSIYQTMNFTWGLGITSTRSSSDETPSRSYDGTLSYSF